jgi:N-acetylglucosamine-6-phosphate deacetylase
MPTMHIAGCILTESGWVDGVLTTDGPRIASIDGVATNESAARDSKKPLVLPGFIDTHVHGGAGRDVMEGGDAAARIAALHAQHGTTAMLATTMTAPMLDIDAAFAALAPLCEQDSHARARLLGVHLEGPYINPAKLGAQPDFVRVLELHDIDRLNAIAPIRVVTLAPELDGHLPAVAALNARGIRVQIGHSLASYEVSVAALAAGASGFTHLFNAMSGLHHRRPGAVGAALAHANYAEIIPDLLHVHPGAIRSAMRAIPQLFCVTDSTAAAGMPDGEYRLGRHTVTKCMGGVRLADGTLAGSTLTMDDALRNLVRTIGLDLATASRCVSTHAADFLGLADRGRLAPGAMADVVVMNHALAIERVVTEGCEVAMAQASTF